MDNIYIEIIGYAAGFLMACTMVPQIVKSIRTKSVGDISWLMLFIYLGSSLLWVIYGVLITSWPVAIADGFAFCVVATQIVVKGVYLKRGEEED